MSVKLPLIVKKEVRNAVNTKIIKEDHPKQPEEIQF